MRLIRVNEAAELFDVSVPTVYSWVKNKQIPHCRLVNAIRFREEDIIYFLEKNLIPVQDEYVKMVDKHLYGVQPK